MPPASSAQARPRQPGTAECNRPPRANAVCERMVGTLRRELLDRILIVNQVQLRRVLKEYLIHYNDHRPHRTLGQRPPNPHGPVPPAGEGSIRRTKILGRLVNEYHHVA